MDAYYLAKMVTSFLQVYLLIAIFLFTAVEPQPSCTPATFRSADGSCNNLKHPTWGKSLEPYNRFLPPKYADGVSVPRVGSDGTSLPDARVVSLTIAKDVKLDNPHLTTMFSTWGLLIALETTKRADVTGPGGTDLNCCGRDVNNPDCVPIMLPANDPFFASFGVKCMPLVRTKAIQDSSKSPFRDQINNFDSFISGSAVYGATTKNSNELRTFTDGKLRTSQSLNPIMTLPAASPSRCGVVNCLLAGNARVNLTPEIASLVTLILRHHNRIADELKNMNPPWADERIYQEARRIIGAIIQLITYRDFLPLLIGLKNLSFDLQLLSNGYYEGYNDDINPTTANVFAAAAYRFGHSALIQSYDRIDPNNRPSPSPNFAHTILNLDELYQRKLDYIVRGLLQQKMGEIDQYYTKEVTYHLFETKDQPGTGADLFAVNLQRGRDHGLAGYNEWREFCHLERATTFEQLNRFITADVVTELKNLYKSVDDIDLYAAGISEYHVEGGVVGPTFACIIGNQFRNLRRGDKFWFENGNHPGAFTLDQLNDVRKMSLAEIICANSETIMQVPENAFSVGSRVDVNCGKFKGWLLNPLVWQDERIRRGEAVGLPPTEVQTSSGGDNSNKYKRSSCPNKVAIAEH